VRPTATTFKQKGVPVDVNHDHEVMVLIPLYTTYGIRGADVILTTPDKIQWADGDIAYFGNWRFYGKWAWSVALNKKHPLRRYVLREIEKEEEWRARKS